MTDHLGESGIVVNTAETGIEAELDIIEAALEPQSRLRSIVHSTHEKYRRTVAALDESLEKLGKVGDVINGVRSWVRNLGPAGIILYNAGKGVVAGTTMYLATNGDTPHKLKNALATGIPAATVSFSLIGLVGAKIAQAGIFKKKKESTN